MFDGVMCGLDAKLKLHSWNEVRGQGLEAASAFKEKGVDGESLASMMDLVEKVARTYSTCISITDEANGDASKEIREEAEQARAAERKRAAREEDRLDDRLIGLNSDFERRKEKNDGSIREIEEEITEKERAFADLNILMKPFKEADFHAERDALRKQAEDLEKANLELAKERADARKAIEEEREQAKEGASVALANIDDKERKALRKIEQRIRERRQSLSAQAKQLVDGLTANQLYEGHQKRIEDSLPDFERFRALSSDAAVPQAFLLGTIGRTICESSNPVTPLLRQLAEDGAHDVLVNMASQNRIFMSGFLAEDLTDGLQLMIRPDGSSDATWDNDNVRWLVYRLLMAYPAGKLQMTLFDPMKSGMSFSGITGMYDKTQEKLINGGIVTIPEMFDSTLNSLEQKMAGLAQGYGDKGGTIDKEAYFSKELIQLVAINDFPNGFDAASIRSLMNLMDKGPDFGMIFIIGMNPVYEEAFVKDPNYQAILSRGSLIQLHGKGGKALRWGDSPYIVSLLPGEDTIEKNMESITTELRRGIKKYKAKTEEFDALFPHIQNRESWLKNATESRVDIPLGIKGAGTVVEASIGGAGQCHHGLIAGATGAGKSTLLHTMIMSIIMNYSPRDVRLVLIDFKEGEEFRRYSRFNIPSFRSITTATEPELALAALRELESEFKKRASAQKEVDDVIVLIFDEVQALFEESVRSDIRIECESILRKLVLQGRSPKIHVILASQNFGRVSNLSDLWSDMKMRITLEQGEDQGGIFADASGLEGAPTGSALLNLEGGRKGKNELFQVGALSSEKLEEYLRDLQEIYATAYMKEEYGSYKTRLLFTNIEDNPEHPFNTLIEGGTYDAEGGAVQVGSMLRSDGDSESFRMAGIPFQLKLGRSNLLMIGSRTSTADSLFVFILLSLLCQKAANAAHSDDEIYLLDYSSSDVFFAYGQEEGEETTFEVVKSVFRNEFVQADATGVGIGEGPTDREVIDRIYDRLQDLRSAGTMGAHSHVYLLLYLVNSALSLTQAENPSGYLAVSTLEKLQAILREGPAFGIHVIAWGQTLAGTEKILNANGACPSSSVFATKMAFGVNQSSPTQAQQEFIEIVNSNGLPATEEGAIVRQGNSAVHFRPFDMPHRAWIQDLSEAYHRVREMGHV